MTDIIDCGRCFGLVKRLELNANSIGVPGSVGPFEASFSPCDVLGRPSDPVLLVERKRERPVVGDAGAAVFLSKFSNLERRDDTGLMDEASVPSFEPSMTRCT